MGVRSLLSVDRQGLLLGRRILIVPHRWTATPRRSIVLLLGSHEGDQLFCRLAVFLELLPGFALDNPHLDEDWSQEIMATCLYESLRSHATSASHGEFSEPLDEVFDKLSLFLFGEKEGVHVDICFFLEEATEEQSFQVIPACNRAF